MLLLNFNFAMIYIIHKLLGFIKNLMNDLRDNIFECFFKKYDRHIFFTKIFFSKYMMKKEQNMTCEY